MDKKLLKEIGKRFNSTSKNIAFMRFIIFGLVVANVILIGKVNDLSSMQNEILVTPTMRKEIAKTYGIAVKPVWQLEEIPKEQLKF